MINERVKQLRKSLGLSGEKFGERLGVKRNTVSQLESGTNNLTDQMFKAICREYNVNPDWLRDGSGDMFVQLSSRDRITSLVEQVLSSDDEFRQKVFIALGELSEEEWNLVRAFVDKLKD